MKHLVIKIKQRAVRLQFITVPTLLLCLVSFTELVIADEIRIGVRAIRGAAEALAQWQPTADYLSQKIPEHTFILVPFEINSRLNQAVSRGEFEFVLTNPASHVEQHIRYGVTPIATLINERAGKGHTRFGSVIFTRSDRDDINRIADLAGKTFMGADEQGFGGWRIAWYELLQNGINPYEDFERLSFGGGIQPNVVFAVRDGRVDAGTVRTDMLEKMAAKGQIKIGEVKILGAKITEGFEFFHSTQLYPEWPFAKLPHTSEDLARKVAANLYNISSDAEAAKKGSYIGWTLPMDYTPVDELLRELRVGPYQMSGPPSWRELLSKYWYYAAIFFVLLFTVTTILVVVVRNNRQLKQVHEELELEIAERKKADEDLTRSRRMLRTVLDTIPVRVFWKDRNLAYLGCNKLFARDAGLSNPKQLIGKTDYEMGWVEQAERYRSDDTRIIQSGQSKLNYEEPQTTPGGDKIWLETSKIPLTDIDGEIFGILGTYVDITDRKRNQQELEEYKQHLEEKVAERTAALESSNRELESYSYSIAHDLRAPLRSLTGFSQILAEDAAAKLNQEEKDALGRIVSAGKHMAELIDDILELSRITRCELRFQRLNLSLIAREIASTLKESDQKRQIEFRIQDDMFAKGDEILLRLAMQNLIDNAWKFTRDNRQPVIEIGKREVNGESVYCVRDNGVGFDMQYVANLFLPFRRLHPTEFDGTGIGLATVQRIIHRHGGRVWAESNPDQGATFCFTLHSEREVQPSTSRITVNNEAI